MRARSSSNDYRVDARCPQSKQGTLRKLTRAVCGLREPNALQSAAAWKRYAFTNYVPVSVSIGNTYRPTNEAWTQAEDEWDDVLRFVAPKAILVLGKGLWGHMPHTQIRLSKNIQGYALANGETAMCFAVPHTARGPAWSVFAAWLAAADRYASTGDIETAISAFRNA